MPKRRVAKKAPAVVRRANVPQFWREIEKSLLSRVSGIRELIRHQASGAAIEIYFQDLLREYLPRRYIVEPGFVVTKDGEMSDYIDLLVVDALHIPPLCNEPPVRMFVAESVVAAIEITSAPLTTVRKGSAQVPKMQDDIRKLAKVRRMTLERTYSDYFPSFDPDGGTIKIKRFRTTRKLPARAILITCGKEGTEETYRDRLCESLRKGRAASDVAWLNLAFSLQHGLYRFEKKGDFTPTHLKKAPLLEFLIYLNHLAATYNTYKIDMTTYRQLLDDPEEHDDMEVAALIA